jgi:hypothetical protein
MRTNTTAATQVAVLIIVDGYKFQFNSADITLRQTEIGATLQISGVGTDQAQTTDLNTYLQSLPLATPVM